MSENKASNGSARRAIVMVIDGCGIGAAPDAERFGDLKTANTLANIGKETGNLKLPNLAKIGLGNIATIPGVPAADKAMGLFGKLEEASNGKDTQTGHWEMMGVVSEVAFPLYPDGFPDEVINAFIKETGCKGILCNKPASGTEVMAQLGEEHQRTGFPIVYTSGDSVFQIACHVDTVPLSTQYAWCEIARKILQGKHRVGRVINRPFEGKPGSYTRRSGDRRDYAVPPPKETLLDYALKGGLGVFGVGKIEDIFVGHGLTHAKHTGSNKEGLELTLQSIARQLSMGKLKTVSDAPDDPRLIFTNLVDTDSLFGHRRDVQGYAGALKEIDEWMGKILTAMGPDDLLVITSDHGNDPTHPGTDHTREYVPLLAYSPSLSPQDVGIRKGFVDVAASLAGWLDVPWQGPGVSFLSKAATPHAV